MSDDDGDPELLTVPDVARRVGVTPGTLRRELAILIGSLYEATGVRPRAAGSAAPGRGPWPCTRPLGGPRRHPGAAPPSITRRCGPVKPPASRSRPPRRGPRSAWPLQTRQRGAPGRDGARGQRRRRKCCGGVPAGDLLGLCLPEMRNVHAGRRCPAWASCITEKFTGSRNLCQHNCLALEQQGTHKKMFWGWQGGCADTSRAYTR